MSLARRLTVAAALAGMISLGAAGYVWVAIHIPAVVLAAACTPEPRRPLAGNDGSATYSGSGPITLTLPEKPDPNDPMPRGGSYVYAEGVSNLPPSGFGTLRVTWFDPARDSVVVNDQPLDGASAPPGMTLTEARGSAILLSDPDDAVVLRGVTLAEWQAGAAAQHRGTAGPDLLQGTAADEVFSAGGGFDTINPAGGDDHVIYASGTTIIGNDPPNSGNDSLDLRRFAPGDLTAKVWRGTLRLVTPDGAVQIQGQWSSPSGNVETVRLADCVLDTAALRGLWHD